MVSINGGCAIGFEIKMLDNMICRRLDKLESTTLADKLTGTHGRVIGFLYHNSDRDLFQRDIEKEFNIRRSTATGILNLMEKNDLIKRESVSYDARLKKLVLTEQAYSLHNMIEKEIDEVEKKLIEGISEKELALFLIVLNKMKENIK